MFLLTLFRHTVYVSRPSGANTFGLFRRQRGRAFSQWVVGVLGPYTSEHKCFSVMVPIVVLRGNCLNSVISRRRRNNLENQKLQYDDGRNG